MGGRGSGVLIVVMIAALLVGLVIVLFFEPGLVETGFISDDDAEQSDTAQRAVLVQATLMAQAPPIPDVLGAASPIYEIAVPAGRLGPFEFSLRLTNPSQDSRNLGAYTWNGDDWVRLGDAVLSSDGISARISLTSAPDNIAILRRLQFRDVIAARVPRGEEPQSLLSGSLTLLHPDGWRPGADGSLLGLVDLPASVIAQNVWPTISAGADLTDLVNDVLASDNLRRQHIANIQHAIQSGQHDGVDIHYLNVSPALRTQFTSFVTELADRLHRDDRGLSVHIPINASGGVGEGAYDLSQLGASADFIVIEPPLDPTLYEAAIDASLPTLLERIESNKLLLALKSNAVVRTSTGFSEITQRAALGIASDLSIREPGPYAPSSRVTLQGAAIMLDNLSSDCAGTTPTGSSHSLTATRRGRPSPSSSTIGSARRSRCKPCPTGSWAASTSRTPRPTRAMRICGRRSLPSSSRARLTCACPTRSSSTRSSASRTAACQATAAAAGSSGSCLQKRAVIERSWSSRTATCASGTRSLSPWASRRRSNGGAGAGLRRGIGWSAAAVASNRDAAGHGDDPLCHL